jgi:hypothetical protein
MDYEPSNSSLTRRDIIGAWVFCAILAALALGLAGNLAADVPAAATLTTEILPCPAAPNVPCRRLADTAGGAVGSVARLHQPTPSRPRAGEPLRPS